MPFTHHSHSGQFCGHATSTLEAVVQRAVAKNMTTLCLTEHIPRERVDFYPEEEADHTEASLAALFDAYHAEARRLQKAYEGRMQIFVGFEGEWIRESSAGMIRGVLKNFEWDLFVGSAHHVHTVPIDFDGRLYEKARGMAGGTDERVFADYFDAQLDMLEALRPPVVAHFDLIRLKSDAPDGSFRAWPGVWDKIMRNLRMIAGYGGVLELNSSSIRKGMKEAYPQVEICKEFQSMGGCFTLSDDSHGVEQVGLNFHKVLNCVKRAGITELCCLAPVSETIKAHDSRFPRAGWKTMSVSDLETHAFWTT